MKNRSSIRTLLSLVCVLALLLSLSACTDGASSGSKTYKIGICNYVDDASLNQIADSIQARLDAIATEKSVTFQISYENCNGDPTVLNQIIANFHADQVDLMIGITTPVSMAMQAATEDSRIPVVFSAVSDPLSAGLVDSLDAPGGNLTGTSDFLDTSAMMDLIFAADPDAHLIALLYDAGQESSATPIAAAKEYLSAKGVAYKEYTGTTVDEIILAVQSMARDGVSAVFTPSDNTVMKAELAIYEALASAGIPHYGGADSFALNGAFVGYGVDYANLGVETANMAADVLLNGADPAKTAVKMFDNGTATVNTETCAALGYDYKTIETAFAPLCIKVQSITTAESFDDLK